MHALILIAALIAGPQDAGSATRAIVTGVCLPFAATGEASDDNLALAGLNEGGGGEGRAYRTRDGRHLVNLTSSGDDEAGTSRRACVVQARAGDFGEVRDAVAGPLERAGFVAVPGEPEDFPVWTKGGSTATVHQNPGRATIVRVSWSILDEEAASGS